jgi:hypothetical protein
MRDPFLKEPLVVSWVDFELRTLHIEVIFLLANEAELELAICANTKVFDFIKLGRCSTVREWAPREVIHYIYCLANEKVLNLDRISWGSPASWRFLSVRNV